MFSGEKRYRKTVSVRVKLKNRPVIMIDTLKYISINPLILQRELIEHPGKYAYIGMLYESTEEEIRDVELDTYTELLETRKADREPARWMLDTLLQSSTKWKRLNLHRKKLKQLLSALSERGRILQNQSSILKEEYRQGRI